MRLILRGKATPSTLFAGADWYRTKIQNVRVCVRDGWIIAAIGPYSLLWEAEGAISGE